MNYLELWRWRHYSKFEVPRLMTNDFYLALTGPATVMPNPAKPNSPFPNEKKHFSAHIK